MAEIANTAWYRLGTVSIADGSTKVTGSGTKFLTAGINPGATFRIDGRPYAWEVAEVVSDTEIQLARPYYGGTVSGASYSIDRNFQSTTNAKLAAGITDLISVYEDIRDGVYKGIEGKSAYDIARQHGFTGTEVQWLESLKAAEEIIKINARLDPISVNNAYAHNSVYRGKDLGSGITAEMSAAIRAGTFEDIYPGDYFTKAIPAYTWTDWEGNTHEEKASANAMIWDIVGCNPLIHETPHSAFKTNHIGVVPRGNLFTAPMNEEDTTAGGYYGSDMFNKHLKRAEAIVKAVFGEEHILAHVDTFCNTVTDGEESAWGTYDNRIVDLMSEYMCFGRKIRWSAEKGSYDHVVIAHTQLPLYQFRPDLAGPSGSLSWLREAVDSESFAVLTTWGGATYHKASNPNNWAGVRPLLLVY